MKFVLLSLFLSLTFTWATEVKVTAGDNAGDDDEFGTSVAIAGDYVIVGARTEDISGSNEGAAYIFLRSGSAWNEQQRIIPSELQNEGEFGRSVSIAGDYAIVGAPNQWDGSFVMSGAAYIFVRSGATWTQQARLFPTDGELGDAFGSSVYIDGDYAIVGASTEDTGGSSAGAAYIFVRSGVTWTQQAKLVASDAQEFDYFGYSVSINGAYAIVGAYHEGSGVGDEEKGAAYVFLRSGSSWSQQAKLVASDAQEYDYFGTSVSINGAYAIVGANGEDAGGSMSGAAYVFLRSGVTWSQQAKLVASDPGVDDYFGSSVSINGNYSIVGAYGEDTEGTDAGAAYSFLRTGSSWSESSKTTASDAGDNDNFGTSVAMSADYAVMGADDDDIGAFNNAGSAYIYETISDLSLPVELSSFTATTGEDMVTLEWTTASEINNDAFILERSLDGKNFSLLAEIKGQGSTSKESNYTFTDNAVFLGVTYYYRLADRDVKGVLTYHTTVNATPNSNGIDFKQVGLIVENFALHSNYPNPFNPETTIRFDVPTLNGELHNITLHIYNSLGQLVNTLYDGQLSGGQYEMTWNANTYPSGVYYINFQSDKFVQSQKMFLVR